MQNAWAEPLKHVIVNYAVHSSPFGKNICTNKVQTMTELNMYWKLANFREDFIFAKLRISEVSWK